MARLVFSDASPLIGLARLDALAWLGALFGEVWLPAEVHAELFAKNDSPDHRCIEKALGDGTLKVWPVPAPVVPELAGIDEGEAACIRIALSQRDEVLLLMDERAGRRAAQEQGLRVTGTAAVVGLAKLKGLIPNARDVFADLHASDFRIAPQVIRQVLEAVGERLDK
jgi:predicted nucleic acid-binding protein